MSERDSDSGQFTSPEPLTGGEGVEADHGFSRMAEPEKPEILESTIEQEAANLKASREVELPQDVVEIRYRDPTGAKVPETETIPLPRGQKDLADYHGALNAEATRHLSNEFALEVDKLRASALAANPELADSLGLSKEDIAAAAEAVAPEISATDVPTEQATQADPYADIEGLDEPTRQAMKVPQIREAVEKEFNKAEEIKTAYSTGLNNAQQFAQASLLAIAPELGNVPIDRWGEGIQILAQANPARGQQLAQMFQNLAALNERQQLVAHHEQARRHHQFEAYVKGQDVQAKELAKKEGINLDYSKLYSYWEGMGVSRQQLAQMYRSNPATASAEAQITQMKAALYDEMMRAPKPIPTRATVPVTRPGTASHRPSGDNSSTIRALQKQLDNATSEKALRIAAKLQSLKRAG
jgi:hypothetical protein